MPLIPLIEICNQHCLFCAAEGRKDDVSFERNLKAIDRELAAGAETIILSGGETTLCPDLFYFIKHIKAKGARVELQSNGLTLSSPRIAKALVLSGVDLFNINFPSCDSEINDMMTGTSGTLSRRSTGVRNLLMNGASVRLTHIVCSLNYRRLPDFVRFAAETMRGVRLVQFSFLKAMGGVLKRPELLPSYSEVSPFIIEAFRICRDNGINAITDHIPPCFLGEYFNLNVDFMKTISGENTDISRKEKKQLPACAGCRFAENCFGPREDYVNLKGGAEIRPVK